MQESASLPPASTAHGAEATSSHRLMPSGGRKATIKRCLSERPPPSRLKGKHQPRGRPRSRVRQRQPSGAGGKQRGFLRGPAFCRVATDTAIMATPGAPESHGSSLR